MKYVEANLDKPRKLRFTSNSLARLEEVLKKPLGEALKPLIQESESSGGLAAIDISMLRAMLWASLLHENPTLTMSQAGDLMDDAMEAGNDGVFEKVFEAISKSGFFMEMKRRGASESGSSEKSNSSTTPESEITTKN